MIRIGMIARKNERSATVDQTGCILQPGDRRFVRIFELGRHSPFLSVIADEGGVDEPARSNSSWVFYFRLNDETARIGTTIYKNMERWRISGRGWCACQLCMSRVRS